MDIRKFFGAPKGKKTPVVQSGNKIKPNEENVKNKLSSFKREEKAEPDKKTKKSQNGSSSSKTTSSLKKSDSKSKSEYFEENIIIDESSEDDEVIACSLDSTPATSKQTKSSEQKNLETSKSRSKETLKKTDNESKDVKSSKDSKKKEPELKKVDSQRKSPRKQHNVSEKERKTTSRKINQISDDESEDVLIINESKDVISSKDSKKKEPELKKMESQRKSPRKQNNVSEKERKTTSRKINQICDDESEDVSIINESSCEDDEEVISSKKTNGLKRKRGRKATKVLDSDSDEEDPLPKKTVQNKRKKKSGISFVNDSDEEKVETAMDKFVMKKTTPAKAEHKKEVSKKAKVDISDFFGTASASASRVERPKVLEKRKRVEVKSPEMKSKSELGFEDDMNDDEDFMKVLDELDGPNVKKVKLSEPQEEKATASRNGGSPASKLANKMKAASTDSVKEEKDINKNNVSTSPIINKTQRKVVPPKKQKSSYAIEMTETKPKTKSPAKSDEITPQKAAAIPKSQSTSKKNDTEDDGFGAKKGGGFHAFKMRGGPQAIGSKEIPEGAENCLEGLTFVITGVLDSIERDDAKSVVEKYGGKVTTSISKKTSYVVVGREPGDSKLNKAKDLKVKQIDEDSFYDLIRTLPGKTSKYELQAKEQLKKEGSVKLQKEKSASLKKLESFHVDSEKEKDKGALAKPLFTQLKNSEDRVSSQVESKQPTPSKSEPSKVESLLWVDKHKPSSLKQIIGQQGDKSNAHKLLHWIQRWHENVIVKGVKAAGNFFGKGGGDGTGFRAALLSGPPGIGKTTTATLVCKEAGFSYVELNASDTRSKKNLKEVVSESLNNQTLVDFMGEDKKSGHHSQHHCVIMDEVDGMAGNQDRGGLQELVQLIKATKIPIICICNDRNSMKMRTLSNYCFDLRFQRPRVEQIKGAMMTLAFREGLKIPPSAVQEIILASNHDIRQVIHNLSVWSATDKNLTFEQVKADAQKAQKDLKLGPFDVCRKVFVSDEETRKMTINDKSDLFFHDYSFAPLFVHENYPHIIPSRAEGNKCKHMACLSRTIDSLCDGDLVEKRIRNEGNWHLLPSQAMFSSVIPGEIMRGSFPQMTNFPAWLGKNSSTGKTDRILQELGRHMGLKISCDKRGLNQDYLPALRMSLTSPLASHGTDGVPGVIQMMDDYDIIKDDFDNILEVSKWPNSIDYMSRVESKTKAALTRMYNKSGLMTPYSTGMGGKKKRGRASAAVDEADLLREGEEDEEAVVESEEEEDDEPVVVPMNKGKASNTKGKGGGGKGRKK